jgi:hypothetical protein
MIFLKKIKMARGTTVGACRCGARRQGPDVVPRGPAPRGALEPSYPMMAGT